MTSSRLELMLVGVLSFGLLAVASVSVGGEHPEHPTKGKKARVAGVKIEDVAKAIDRYVRQETSLKGGYFLVYDKKADKPLVLTLDKIHKERLSRIAPDVYFACADFKTPEGKVYDLDIFLKGTDKSSLTVTEISVHKENGKPRYNWYEEKGLWKKKAAGTAAKKKRPEHPEHPK